MHIINHGASGPKESTFPQKQFRIMEVINIRLFPHCGHDCISRRKYKPLKQTGGFGDGNDPNSFTLFRSVVRYHQSDVIASPCQRDAFLLENPGIKRRVNGGHMNHFPFWFTCHPVPNFEFRNTEKTGSLTISENRSGKSVHKSTLCFTCKAVWPGPCASRARDEQLCQVPTGVRRSPELCPDTIFSNQQGRE